MWQARLISRRWLYRLLEVSNGAAIHTITYNGWGNGSEFVSVDGQEVLRLRSAFWFAPRFDFSIDGSRACVEVHVWPWLTIKAFKLAIDGTPVYSEPD